LFFHNIIALNSREFGYYYYRARYYDPLSGRFNTADPLGYMAGDANLYRYTGNKPTGYTDPLGLFCGYSGGPAGASMPLPFGHPLSGANMPGGPGSSPSGPGAPNGPGSPGNPNNPGGPGGGGDDEDVTNTIIVQRTWETNNSTVSTFTMNDGAVTGFILERPGGTPQQTITTGSNVRIQAGTYTYVTYNSPTHGSVLLLQDVPGRNFIEMHTGNYPGDTQGCLLPGTTRGTDFVGHSRDAFNQILEHAGNSGTIIIYDPLVQ
jgi:RHS repeat-associated protein